MPNSVVEDGARRMSNSLSKNGRDPKMIVAIQLAAQRKQFMDNVVRIDNYSVGGKPVTTAEDFYEVADTDLIREIIGAMEHADRLTEGQRKNCLPASGTASSDGARTEAGATTAQPAQSATGS